MAHGSYQPSSTPHSPGGIAGVALHHHGLFYTIGPGVCAAPDSGAAHPQAPHQHSLQPRFRRASFSGGETPSCHSAAPRPRATAGSSRLCAISHPHVAESRSRPCEQMGAAGRKGFWQRPRAVPSCQAGLPAGGQRGEPGAPCSLRGRGRADTRIACTPVHPRRTAAALSANCSLLCSWGRLVIRLVPGRWRGGWSRGFAPFNLMKCAPAGDNDTMGT